jgi:hypothetical protein
MPEADEEDQTHPGELDSDKAGRKVWIVRVSKRHTHLLQPTVHWVNHAATFWLAQVPPYVAKQWREAIAASAEGLVDEDSAEAATLGHLTLAEVRWLAVSSQGHACRTHFGLSTCIDCI